MAKKRRVVPKQQSSTNYLLWLGGFLGLVFLGVVILLVVNLVATPDPVVPTPALTEPVTSIESYCQAHPDRCLISGDPAAPGLLIEISDYGCSHCYNFNRDSAPILREQYLLSGRLGWLILPYALSNVTALSSESLLCAAEQSVAAGFLYHERLFELQTTRRAHTPSGFAEVAAGIPDLDLDQFNRCVEDRHYQGVIDLNRQAAAQLGINSTPTFFLNGRKIDGNQPLEVFTSLLDNTSDN